MRQILALGVLFGGAVISALLHPLVFQIYIVLAPILVLIIILVKKFGNKFLPWTMNNVLKQGEKRIMQEEHVDNDDEMELIDTGPKIHTQIGTRGPEKVSIELKGQNSVDPTQIAIEAINLRQTQLVHEIMTSNNEDETKRNAIDYLQTSNRERLDALSSSKTKTPKKIYPSVPRNYNPYGVSKDEGNYSER